MNIFKKIKQSVCEHDWGDFKIISLSSGTGYFPMEYQCNCKKCGKKCSDIDITTKFKLDPLYGSILNNVGSRFSIDYFVFKPLK